MLQGAGAWWPRCSTSWSRMLGNLGQWGGAAGDSELPPRHPGQGVQTWPTTLEPHAEGRVCAGSKPQGAPHSSDEVPTLEEPPSLTEATDRQGDTEKAIKLTTLLAREVQVRASSERLCSSRCAGRFTKRPHSHWGAPVRGGPAPSGGAGPPTQHSHLLRAASSGTPPTGSMRW